MLLGGAPGAVGNVFRVGVRVGEGQGALRILELQLEGKKRMSAHDFLLGVRVTPGERLGQQ